MNKIKLKTFYVNQNIQFNFNDGENYIIGMNGSGKTTLFDLIQYIFGVRKTSLKLLTTSISNNVPYIECQFGNKQCKISRKLDSNEITFEGDINKTVKVGSKDLNDTYTELLNINFYSGLNDKSSLEIIKMSFLSEIELGKSYLNRGNNYYKILGYNEEYLTFIKKDIENLKGVLSIERQALKMLENYKESVENSLLKKQSYLGESYTEVKQVLETEFSSIKDNFLGNYDLLRNAEDIYQDELYYNTVKLDEKISDLDLYFQSTINQLIPNNKNLYRSDLKNLIEKRNFRTLSISERIALLFALHITFCRNKVHNGLGFLITDCLFLSSDNQTRRNIRDKITEVTKQKELQYIEFCNDSTYIPKDSVIFEMSSRLGGGIFD